MQISAKTDYALRAVCLLAGRNGDAAVKADEIAAAQQIPRAFLDGILLDLRRAGLVSSRRGPFGGHRLARPADGISVADVVRAMEGPLALVHGMRPEELTYDGSAACLQDVWVALRSAVRNVLERTSVQQVVDGDLPDDVAALSADARAWASVRPAHTGTVAARAVGAGPTSATPVSTAPADTAPAGTPGDTAPADTASTPGAPAATERTGA